MEQEIAVDGAARTAESRAPSRPGRPTFREVFAVREFRALWLAQLLSVAGDQLARVAMTVLVFDRTHSALWTALTYAVTFLPWVIGGLAPSGLADRRPRQQVMLASDAARTEMAAGVRLVLRDRTLRTLMLLGWLVAFSVVPMGLRAPSAASFHTWLPIPVSTGLVFAAGPFGPALGAVVLGRLVPPASRQRLIGPLATAACGLLLLCWLQPEMIAALVIIAGSGACASYQLASNAAFVARVPPDRRGQAFSLANGGMQVSQGLWIVLPGAAAAFTVFSPATAIAISGGLGAVLAAALAMAWPRHPGHMPVKRLPPNL